MQKSKRQKELERYWLALFIGRLIAGIAIAYGLTAWICYSWKLSDWPCWILGIDIVLVGIWFVLCSWFHYIFFSVDFERVE